MSRNMVQFQKGLSDARFDEMYGSEEQCHAALVQLRWPDGFECPDCRGHGHCLVNRGARRLFQCNACRKQTSVKAGTIFASSKLPLRIWFKAIFLLTQSKKGISSIELGCRLGVTQTTAWVMKHKLAQVMLERNASKRLKAPCRWTTPASAALVRVGADEGPRARRRSWRRSPQRTTENPIRSSCGLSKRSALSRSASSPLRRSPPTPSFYRRSCVFRGRRRRRMRARRDQDRRRPASRQNARLQMGQHGAGQHQGGFGRNYRAVRSKHVPRYLAEFEYRFNRRYDLSAMIPRLAFVALRTAPMPYRLLKLADVAA